MNEPVALYIVESERRILGWVKNLIICLLIPLMMMVMIMRRRRKEKDPRDTYDKPLPQKKKSRR